MIAVLGVTACSSLPTAELEWPPRSANAAGDAGAAMAMPPMAMTQLAGSTSTLSSTLSPLVLAASVSPSIVEPGSWASQTPGPTPSQTPAPDAAFPSRGAAAFFNSPNAPDAMGQNGLFGMVPAVVRTYPRLQCVPFAREASGIQIYGNANTWWRQAAGRYERSQSPDVGAVIVMRGYRTTRRGHVAVVTAIRNPREIVVDHANWLNKGEVTVNTPMLDVSEDNDWSRVRVWHIPSGNWGARVYSVQGFIHQD